MKYGQQGLPCVQYARGTGALQHALIFWVGPGSAGGVTEGCWVVLALPGAEEHWEVQADLKGEVRAKQFCSRWACLMMCCRSGCHGPLHLMEAV